MQNNSGGLSPSERQRQTAAEIARKKVLATFQQSAKSAPETKQQSISSADWQKYHTAWQNYYQKYYNDYYSQAAKSYVAKEKLKAERARADDAVALGEASAEPKTDSYSSLPSGAITSVIEDPNTIQRDLRRRVRARATDAAKLHRRRKKFIPLIAGLAVVLVFLFLQYNRLIFAPIAAYVSPGNSDSNTITPIDPSVSTAVSDESKLIIPKLNVDVPIHFGISNDTASVMSAMNNGVAQFSIPGASAMPGEVGNLVITGHSAGDIYSSNQYKFIFSGLERLEAGDLIYIDYQSVRYTYRMTETKTVDPSDVASLQYSGDKAMLTLVTCTPLGTSKYRLLVFAEQINPVVNSSNTQSSEVDDVTSAAQDVTMPSNEKSFVENIWDFLTGQ